MTEDEQQHRNRVTKMGTLREAIKACWDSPADPASESYDDWLAQTDALEHRLARLSRAERLANEKGDIAPPSP